MVVSLTGLFYGFQDLCCLDLIDEFDRVNYVADIGERLLVAVDAVDEVLMHIEQALVTRSVVLVDPVDLPATESAHLIVLVDFDLLGDFHIAADADAVQLGTDHSTA